jgi:hypothetical protein
VISSIQSLSHDLIQVTSFLLLILLCGEVVLRTAMMTYRAIKASWLGKNDHD